MAKVGRNDLCRCGSGKKFKRCCDRTSRQASMATRVAVLVMTGALVAAILFGIASRDDEATGSNRVWSAEHGHYHDSP